MPLNTDPNAIPDDEYFSEYERHAAEVGDAGLHTHAEKWLIENTDYQPEADDGADR